MGLYQKAGLHYLRDTLFDDALSVFQKGRLDPYVFLSLFPEYHDSTSVVEYKSNLSFLAQWGSMQDISMLLNKNMLTQTL